MGPAEGSAKEPAKGSVDWAKAEAKRLGRKVAVPAEMGETRDVFANPDGTFTATMRVAPVRVRRGGGWVPVDTTLRRHPDGRIRPVATSKPVVFSGGGREPLVRLYDGGRWVALHWPGPLPTPSLSESSATYAEVLPGVDLRMKATAQGYSKVLVVKNRNSALGRLRFGLTTKGLTATSDRHGNISFRDGKGAPVFVASSALMWDSAGRQAVGKVRLMDRAIVLTPDRRLLTDPATRFPVFVDPDIAIFRNGWGIVLSGHPNNTYWGGDFEHIAKVGLCPETLDPRPAACGSPHIGVARSFFAFDSSWLLGRHVLDAEFNLFLAYTPSCVGGQMQVWGTNPVDGGLTWNNQPFPGGGPSHLGSDHLAGGYNSTCPGRWLGYNATTAVVNSLNFSGGRTAIMIKAGDEGQEHAWKKFLVNGEAPSLSATYNTRPDQPTGLTVEGKPCAQAPNEPHVNPFIDNDPAKGMRGPQLAVRATDPDGGSLRTRFEWKPRGGADATIVRADTVSKASGSTFTADVSASSAVDGARLSYRAIGNDGIDWGVAFAPSNTTWCDVTIDRTAPNVAPTVTSADYPECRFETCPTGGGIGRTGAFTLGRNGVADVAGFRYDLHDQPSTFVAARSDGTATALVTPFKYGPADLFVRSVDKAGNLGPMIRYHFWVGLGTPPSGHWRLNGLDETTILDDSSSHHDGTVSPSSSDWRTGRHGEALWLNGTASASVTTGNGPTLDTSKTFSVAAWARLDRIGGYPTVVSQDGSQASGLHLAARPDGKWAFAMYSNDIGDGGPASAAVSTTPIQVGVWTHLVGVYDQGLQQVRLYVNGALAGTASKGPSWRAGGSFAIGRSKNSGQPFGFWPGSIDDVQAYDRALSVEEIQALATTPAVEELFLPFDEGTGSGTIDASGNYHHGAFSAGASWVPGRVGSGAVRLNGSGTVAVSGASVQTDNSFTVTALVRLDAADGAFQTAVSQDGPLSSGFALQYSPRKKKWVFAVSPQDGNAPAWMVAEPPGLAQAGEWTHLAGVYDAAKGELRLYINGSLEAVQPGRVVANVPGPVLVGRAKQGDQDPDQVAYLRGDVDDVHVWTGVRTGDQIREEFLNPVTKRTGAYSGQLSRYANVAGHHVVTTEIARPGSHFEGSMGLMAPDGAPDTVTIYSCRRGTTDYFLARGGCSGHLELGKLGALYQNPPAGITTLPVYSCAVSSGSHFTSNNADCEGTTVVGLLGYARGYHKLIRSFSPSNDDHITSIFRVPSHYAPEHSLGMVSGPYLPGTTGLLQCRDGNDWFASNQSDCEGKTVVRWIGHIWTVPPDDVTGVAKLFRCRGTDGERWESLDPNCEGRTVDRSLGYVVTEL
jgi:hypothetical protein